MAIGSGKERLVIVGNGMAANAFLDEVTRTAPGRYSITVFGRERHTGYNRVLLSEVLSGGKSAEEIRLHAPEWYAERGITVHSSSRVDLIDRAGRRVVSGSTEAAYDRLLIATGAAPFVPELPGRELDGVVTFRELDDCGRIRELAGRGKQVVVIGGGLLGIEAAGALRALGMEVTIVHLADRLMERQLDGVSAGLLREDLEARGIRVLLGAETAAFEGEGGLERVAFKDGGGVEAGLAVVSAGIRPEASLARASGIYTERGIVVSDTMQTFDPAVYSIGECVQHRGRTFGLVAPVFEQARVAANQLAGDGRSSFKYIQSSARLKFKGLELYSAGESSGDDSIEFFDRRERVYRKISFSEGRISGFVMYGDASGAPELFSMMAKGEDAGHRRKELLSLCAGASGPSSAQAGPDTIVCGCKGVTRKTILDAIGDKGLFTREDVSKETGACSSCGGCAPAIDAMLAEAVGESGVVTDKGICGCTRYGREDILKNIREKGLKSVGEVMATLGWESTGCDSCRPAINYYVSLVWPGEVVDDPASRLINERAAANVQKDGTFSVVPRIYGGVTTPGELRRIAEAASEYGVPLVKITGGQRIALVGVRREDLPGVWARLAMPSGFAYAKAVRTVKTCIGSSYCRYGTQDSMSLGIELERRLNGLWTPAKVKLGVSGCPRNCAESGIKDIGIVGVAGAWEVYAGGSGGIELKAAERVANLKTAGETVDAVCALVQHYREEAHYGERTFKWIRRAGLKRIRMDAIEDPAKRAALLKRLDAALEHAAEPWAAAGPPGVRRMA